MAIVVGSQEHRGVDNMLGVDSKVLLTKSDGRILADAYGIELLCGSGAKARVFGCILPFGDSERCGIGDSLGVCPTIGESEIGVGDVVGVAWAVEIVGSPHLVAADDESVEVALLDCVEILWGLEF